MIPDRANQVRQWPFDKLVVILLRQFRRLLDQQGVTVTDAQMQEIAQAAAAHAALPEPAAAIRTGLNALVAQSLEVLSAWDLSFAQSLSTEMSAIAGWETTADFLDIANRKANAEIRISAGSALLLILGETGRASLLIDAIEHDLKALGQLDVDAIIAQRALLHASGIDAQASDWLSALRAWVASQPGQAGHSTTTSPNTT